MAFYGFLFLTLLSASRTVPSLSYRQELKYIFPLRLRKPQISCTSLESDKFIISKPLSTELFAWCFSLSLSHLLSIVCCVIYVKWKFSCGHSLNLWTSGGRGKRRWNQKGFEMRKSGREMINDIDKRHGNFSLFNVMGEEDSRGDFCPATFHYNLESQLLWKSCHLPTSFINHFSNFFTFIKFPLRLFNHFSSFPFSSCLLSLNRPLNHLLETMKTPFPFL